MSCEEWVSTNIHYVHHRRDLQTMKSTSSKTRLLEFVTLFYPSSPPFGAYRRMHASRSQSRVRFLLLSFSFSFSCLLFSSVSFLSFESKQKREGKRERRREFVCRPPTHTQHSCSINRYLFFLISSLFVSFLLKGKVRHCSLYQHIENSALVHIICPLISIELWIQYKCHLGWGLMVITSSSSLRRNKCKQNLGTRERSANIIELFLLFSFSCFLSILLSRDPYANMQADSIFFHCKTKRRTFSSFLFPSRPISQTLSHTDIGRQREWNRKRKKRKERKRGGRGTSRIGSTWSNDYRRKKDITGRTSITNEDESILFQNIVEKFVQKYKRNNTIDFGIEINNKRERWMSNRKH